MPVVVAAGAIDELAFGIIAIVILLTIATFVVNPIRGASGAVSGLPVIGGAIAWVLWRVADFVQVTIDSMQWIVNKGRSDAVAAYNWLHYWTFVYEFGWIINAATWVQQYSGALTSIVNMWWGLWWQAYVSLPNYIVGLLNSIAGIEAWANNILLPRIAGIEAGIRVIDSFVRGYVIDAINRLTNDVNAIRNFIDSPFGLARDIADSEARAEAYARSVTLPLSLAITSIEDSPCMKMCEPLGELGQFIQIAEDAGLLAILIALIHQAQTNPGSVATEIDETIGAAGRDVFSALQLGIRS